jgi:Fatty acid desaturase
MNSPMAIEDARGVLRYSRWDALVVGLALLHGVFLLAVPFGVTVALGLWWNSNTISHYFIHKPYFRSPVLNRLFSCYLTLLLGLPQVLWRDRHLAHHAAIAWKPRVTKSLVVECGIVLGLWLSLLWFDPRFFLTAYIPGWLAGLGLCWLHGHFEHVRGTVSHRGWLYNFLFLNDGLHIEHHNRPTRHWSELRHAALGDGQVSRWPAVLRWLDEISLENLERLVMQSRILQHFMLTTHERAFRRLLPAVAPTARIGIIGGGLFPRTALILRKIIPEARLAIIDADAKHLDTARTFPLGDTEFIHGHYAPRSHTGYDVFVVPLAYIGDREQMYCDPPADQVLIHDWCWRHRGQGTIISWLLLKRLNLVTR